MSTKLNNNRRRRKNRFGIDEQKECPLCIQPFGNKGVVLPYRCEHMFHRDCISKWSGTCPMCREFMTREEYLIQGTINKYHLQNIKINDLLWIKDNSTGMFIKGNFIQMFLSEMGIVIRLGNVKTIYKTNPYYFDPGSTFDVLVSDDIEFIRIIVNK